MSKTPNETNPKQQSAFSKHPMWVAIISVGFGCLLTFVLGNVTELFKPVATSFGVWLDDFFFGVTPATPAWVFLRSTLSLLFIGLVSWPLFRAVRGLFRRTPRSKYTSDVFEGIRWYWEWGSDGKPIMNMPPECAKHELPLQELQSGNGLGVPMEFFFRCDDCKSNFGRQDKWELQDRAERRAQQRLNDGSWIDAGKRISDARSGTAT